MIKSGLRTSALAYNFFAFTHSLNTCGTTDKCCDSNIYNPKTFLLSLLIPNFHWSMVNGLKWKFFDWLNTVCISNLPKKPLQHVIYILQHAKKDNLGLIVKAIAVFTVQFQRDVKRKRENVLMDARLDGNFRHVIHVRHVAKFFFKPYQLSYHIYLLLIFFSTKRVVFWFFFNYKMGLKKMWHWYNVVTCLYQTYITKPLLIISLNKNGLLMNDFGLFRTF